MRRGATELDAEDVSVRKRGISWREAIGNAVGIMSSDQRPRLSPSDGGHGATAVMIAASADTQHQLFGGCSGQSVATVNVLPEAACMLRWGRDC